MQFDVHYTYGIAYDRVNIYMHKYTYLSFYKSMHRNDHNYNWHDFVNTQSIKTR